MRALIRRHLCYANVMATTAVFIALGGSAVAAKYMITSSNQIKNGVITGKDVKNSSLTGIDIKDKSLTVRDFSGSLEGPKGDTGATGPQGPKGDTGSQGAKGDPGDFPETLASGRTVRGYWASTGFGSTTGYDSLSFGFQLASRPDYPVVVPKNAAPTTSCPGTFSQPEAAPGQLCIYIARLFNVAHVGTVDAVGGTSPGASRFGTAVYVSPVDALPPNFQWAGEGTWAVTAR